MKNVILFAGTSEGRFIAENCAGGNMTLHVCVATEYGETLIEESENVRVHTGRLNDRQMEEMFISLNAELVIDATHPYAQEVTKTILRACENTGREYLRLLRSADHEGTENCIFADDTESAVRLLNTTSEKALLTVGSKELASYTAVNDWKNRLYARMLPLPGVVAAASALGFEGKNLICMQGPFTKEMNAAMLKMTGAKYLVTKDTGAAGGFSEKLAAAKEAGAQVIVIRRPLEETGVSADECLDILEKRFGGIKKKKVTVLGVGTGSAGTLTEDAHRALTEAGLIIGAKRLTESLAAYGCRKENAVLPKDIAAIINACPERDIVVAMSGDTGFYSGTKKLLPLLSGNDVTVLPGMSSVVYFCSRINESWDDAKLISTHGRSCNFVAKVKRCKKVISLTGGDVDAQVFISCLAENGLGHVQVTVGERLSYENETITTGTAEELTGRTFDSLAVLMVKNDKASEYTVTHGLDDASFIRAEVPMTKQEVRAITLSKLELKKDSVCWDIGAGTGSVSLEMAMCCEDGEVYAVEKNPAACRLIEENKKHLAVTNVQVIEGVAPENTKDLPAPTHVFIGGSSGNMDKVIETALERNPNVRIVINTVTAESFAEAVTCLKNAKVSDPDIVSVNVSRGRKLGSYHLMTAQNPVFVISCTGGAK